MTVVILLTASVLGMILTGSRYYAKPVQAVPADPAIYDDFNGPSLSTFLWTSSISPGLSLSQTGGQLVATIPASATGSGGFLGGFQSGASSNCFVTGDFDVQVDYNLINWPTNLMFPGATNGPAGNGVRVGLGVSNAADTLLVERDSFGNNTAPGPDFTGAPREAYAVHGSLEAVKGFNSTANVFGKLRIVRTGSGFTGFYYVGGVAPWARVSSYTGITTGTVQFVLNVWSYNGVFNKVLVQVGFDNFQVNTGSVYCSTGAIIIGGSPIPGVICEVGTTMTFTGMVFITGTFTFSWAFGTGATATGPTATYSYGLVGTFTVTLTISFTATANVTLSQSLRVSPAGTVGALASPSNKLALLAPYLTLGATIAVAAAATFYFRHNGRRKLPPGSLVDEPSRESSSAV